ncbi:hypothetical protein PF010_g10604 [Phytophthora fragariae]|uniref:EamA domain-containing protein n=1 Tax=Phytophthora fragariae TaxID=53985 RepID=A0A6G0L920_9STRA|nr:hypothetical protein PF010_g10604 [Phytophthora fragariae]
MRLRAQRQRQDLVPVKAAAAHRDPAATRGTAGHLPPRESQPRCPSGVSGDEQPPSCGGRVLGGIGSPIACKLIVRLGLFPVWEQRTPRATVLILDQPFDGLDVKARRQLQWMLRQFTRGFTRLLVEKTGEKHETLACKTQVLLVANRGRRTKWKWWWGLETRKMMELVSLVKQLIVGTGLDGGERPTVELNAVSISCDHKRSEGAVHLSQARGRHPLHDRQHLYHLQHQGADGGADNVVGDPVALFAASMYGVSTTATRRPIPDDESATISLVFGFSGVINMVCLLPVVLTFQYSAAESADARDRDAHRHEGGLSTTCCPTTWARSVLLTSPTVATGWLSLTVPLAIVANFWLHGMLPTHMTLLASALVISGFVLINVGTKQNQHQ